MANPAAATTASSDDLEQERRLVERARTDAQAFAALYDRYVRRVYRYAYHRLGTGEWI